MESFSGDRYRLLESIFSWEDDIRFLASQPGYNPKIGRQHRNAKRKLAYAWLEELRADFDEVYREGVRALVDSPISEQDPNLIFAFERVKFTFRKRMLFARLRLLWEAPAADDVRRLSTAFEHLISYNCIITDS